jgi:predicted DsbA family dithiol-disulfide isomerase
MKPTLSLQIDFISDVACPWCAIGLHSLEEALRRAADVVNAEITFQPYELSPDMPAGGVNHDEHIAAKYGSTLQQIATSRDNLRARGAGVGFTFNVSATSRIYNTFGAHQLLHWAKTLGKQVALKHALLKANFTTGENISNSDALVAIAAEAGLDSAQAREVLTTQRYAAAVREAEQLWMSRGIQSVPSIIINQKWLLSGGQPPEIFEQALRQIAAG